MTLEKSDVWMNKSKSGNGFTIKVRDELYTGSMSVLEKFLNGDIKGINLALVKPDNNNGKKKSSLKAF
jgi:hypothetical protein